VGLFSSIDSLVLLQFDTSHENSIGILQILQGLLDLRGNWTRRILLLLLLLLLLYSFT